MKRFVTLLGIVLLCSSLSHAAVTINIVESSGDVVATASGTLNVSALGSPILTSANSSFIRGQAANPSRDGEIIVGTGLLDFYIIDTTVAFSTGGTIVATTK